MSDEPSPRASETAWEESADIGILADGNCLHDPLDLSLDPGRGYEEMLRMMVVIRAAEEKIGDMVAKGIVKCPCHLAIGQEAVAVGVADHVRPGDRVFGAHRSHSHYVALGGSLRGLMAEVQGKDTGASRGMGGSMHLIDQEHGLLGTVPIVGATIPIAVGAALAAQMDGRGALAVSFFGDGATEEGVFHESMNLAAILKVPVLFVCENNLFSSHLHIALRQPRNSAARFAQAHAIPWRRVDGNDVAAVSMVAEEGTASCRSGEGPFFIEAVTYRWRGHVGPREDEDVGVKRKQDLNLWKRRDPIRRLCEALVNAGRISTDHLDNLWRAAREAVEAAWAMASEDAFPEPKALLGRVYGDDIGGLEGSR